MFPIEYEFARRKIDDELKRAEMEHSVRSDEPVARTSVSGRRWFHRPGWLGRLARESRPSTNHRTTRPAGA